MMQITGGKWRGRKLSVLDREGLRPTSSRVKESIFSILESLEWKRSGQPDYSSWCCLDLFAGVGGLGLDMLSRGALHCVFVEKDRAHAKLLQKNILSLNCLNQTSVLVEDVSVGGWKSQGPFDLVFLDPPYAESKLPALLTALASDECLRPNGVVIFEHDPKVLQGEIIGLTLHSTRTLGPAGISVYLRNA